MFRIMIKRKVTSNSALAEKTYELYGSEVTTKTNGTSTTTFTPFETEDTTVLATELVKLDSIYGHENLMVVKIVDVTYGVEIATDEEDTEIPSEPTEPDDTIGDDTTDDGDDTTEP